MPIYEYICKDCGNQFDALRSMKDADNLINCKNCSSENTQRKLSKCYAKSDGHSVTPSGGCGGGCGSCSGGSCGSCHH